MNLMLPTVVSIIASLLLLVVPSKLLKEGYAVSHMKSKTL